VASSRILDSRYFDKLSANRLEALSIKSDNIKPGPDGPGGPGGPSYLFSLLLKDATFTPNTTGGTLTFDLPLHSGDNVIMFSDRPFRQTSFISFTEFISAFTSDNSNNSFQKDPPNAVLVHSEEQRTYIVRYSSSDSTTVTFNLELLAGETNVSSEVISGRMNLFVDNFIDDIKAGIKIIEAVYDGAKKIYDLVAPYKTYIDNFINIVKRIPQNTNIRDDGDANAANQIFIDNLSGSHPIVQQQIPNDIYKKLAKGYYNIATNTYNDTITGHANSWARFYYILAGDNNTLWDVKPAVPGITPNE